MDFNNYALDLLEDDQKMETERTQSSSRTISVQLKGVPQHSSFRQRQSTNDIGQKNTSLKRFIKHLLMLLRVLYAQIHWNWNHLRKTVLKTQEYLTRDHSVCPVLPLDVFTQTRCQNIPRLFSQRFPRARKIFCLKSSGWRNQHSQCSRKI